MAGGQVDPRRDGARPPPWSLVILISLVSSTLSTILLAAVYVYAAEGKVPGAFDAGLLEGAFQAK